LKKLLVFALLAFSIILPSAAFAEAGMESVEVNGTTYDVNYDATGLTVLGMDTETSPPTLIIFVETAEVSGTLEVTLDRAFFDSTADGADEDFLVLADGGIDVEFTDSATETQRVLTIQVPSGTSSIDILGTTFGTGKTVEETPIEEPEETPVEEPEAVPEEPEMTCGPGTVLQDGTCVLEQVTPPVEEPVEETPEPTNEMTCGPGTVLKDGTCVLDQTCGAGTILVDGQCVLDTSQPAPTPKSSRGMAFEFVAPLIGAFIIAFIVMIVLWAIGKAGRNKN
jgi:hypothetical protein